LKKCFHVSTYVYTFAAVISKTEQILLRAKSVFMRCGLRNVTMDDMCREMGISKKTLYQHVADKSDLVVKTVEKEIEKDQSAVKEILEKGHNVIDELWEITRYTAVKFQQVHPATLFEMQKYYPVAWQLFEQHRNGFIVNTISNNIIRGIEDGLYRSDINPALIARLYAVKIDLLADHSREPVSNVSDQAIFFETLKYHLRGICNPTGLLYLEEKLIQMQPYS
jgi:TetR/AcrR family transcriptional regulator, cholesterol catabolism regulator